MEVRGREGERERWGRESGSEREKEGGRERGSERGREGGRVEVRERERGGQCDYMHVHSLFNLIKLMMHT